MITALFATSLVAIPLVAAAWIARWLRWDVEELAWRLVVLALLAIPLAWQLPRIDVGFDVPRLTATEVVFASEPPMLTAPEVAWWLFVPSIVLLARLALAVIYTRKLRARVPIVVGLLRPRIVMPAGADAWPRDKREAVLAHESAHVRRRDPLWRFLAQLAIAIFWFHPAAWLAASALERLAEDAADRAAIDATGDRRKYAEVLLDVAATMTASPRRVLAAAMLDRRSLARRIDTILAARAAPRAPLLASAFLIAIAATSVFAATMTKHVIVAPVVDGDELREQIRDAVRNISSFR